MIVVFMEGGRRWQWSGHGLGVVLYWMVLNFGCWSSSPMKF
jgi:hypothetical protein